MPNLKLDNYTQTNDLQGDIFKINSADKRDPNKIFGKFKEELKSKQKDKNEIIRTHIFDKYKCELLEKKKLKAEKANVINQIIQSATISKNLNSVLQEKILKSIEEQNEVKCFVTWGEVRTWIYQNNTIQNLKIKNIKFPFSDSFDNEEVKIAKGLKNIVKDPQHISESTNNQMAILGISCFDEKKCSANFFNWCLSEHIQIQSIINNSTSKEQNITL